MTEPCYEAGSGSGSGDQRGDGPKSVICDSSGAQGSRYGNEPVTDRLSCANAGIAGTALLLRDKRHTLDCFRSVATAP